MHRAAHRKHRFVLWGIGAVYNKMRNALSYYELTGQLEIVGIVAKDAPKARTLDGIPLYRSERVGELEYDYVLVLSDNRFLEIAADAARCGIKRERLLHYKVLQIPGMVLGEYIKLYESRLTVISNNCWGGIAYSTLGLECLSPTKNLFLEDGDYIRFISDLRGYLAVRPRYSHTGVDAHSGEEYPVLTLGDINIHCNHAADPERAIDDWDRRTKKVNFDNMLVEMYTEDRRVARAFQDVACGCRKVCFVPWETKEPFLVHVEEEAWHKGFWDAVNRGASAGGIQLDLVKLLGGDGVVSRLG